MSFLRAARSSGGSARVVNMNSNRRSTGAASVLVVANVQQPAGVSCAQLLSQAGALPTCILMLPPNGTPLGTAVSS